MSMPSARLLSALLPGAGHIHHGRPLVGWTLALVWTGSWHIVVFATWVVPQSFADGSVPAAVGAAGLTWLAGLILLPAPPADFPAPSPNVLPPNVPPPAEAAGSSKA